MADCPKQVLTFTLAEETYGVDILRVQEIRGWAPVTKIPNAPSHVLGVLNLRGKVVPVIDLRMRFALEKAEYVAVTVIVVVSVQCKDGRRDVGVVVDGVSDVVNVEESRVRSAPELGAKEATEHLFGLLTTEQQRMIVILDIDKLIGSDLTGAAAMATDAMGSAA